MFCTHCGKKNPDVANFCFSCGTVMPTTRAETAPALRSAANEADIPPAASSAPLGTTRHRKCPECGLFSPGITERCDCGYHFQTGTRTAPAIQVIGYGGFWKRFCAAFVDGLATTGLSMVIAIIVGGTLWLSTGSAPESATWTLVYYVTSIPAVWLYFALSESSAKQATYGKKALGLIVTDLQGRRITFARATGRHFLKWLNIFTLGIGLILAGITAKKQALHDLLARTLVVRTE